MILRIERPLDLAVKAFLNALRLEYDEGDDHWLYLGGSEMCLHLQPRSWLGVLGKQLRAERLVKSAADLALAFQNTMDYMVQMDRWKTYYDKLSWEQKCSAVIVHLEEHLQKTILNAQSHYQRSEAIGLNLAKADILLGQIAAQSHPRIAIAGDVTRAASLTASVLSGVDLSCAFDYYSCFRYQDLSAKGSAPERFLRWFWRPECPHYVYREHCAIDRNQRLYDGMMIVVQRDAAVSGALRQLCPKIAKPVVFYEFEADDFDLSAFTAKLVTLQNRISTNQS